MINHGITLNIFLTIFLFSYRQEKRKNAKEIMTDAELLGDLYTTYYNNTDLKLLLDLLAESSGVAPSLRIMALFDKEFRRQSEPFDLRVNSNSSKIITKVI